MGASENINIDEQSQSVMAALAATQLQWSVYLSLHSHFGSFALVVYFFPHLVDFNHILQYKQQMTTYRILFHTAYFYFSFDSTLVSIW